MKWIKLGARVFNLESVAAVDCRSDGTHFIRLIGQMHRDSPVTYFTPAETEQIVAMLFEQGMPLPDVPPKPTHPAIVIE